jgi:hypothetical protein
MPRPRQTNAPRGRAGDRRLALRGTALRLVRLAQFLAEKFHGQQRCNDGGADLLAREAELKMGNVSQRDRGGPRRDHSHQITQKSVVRRIHAAICASGLSDRAQSAGHA